MPILYSTKVRAEGGRAGSVSSSDGLLKLNLAMPKALGGKEDATNPEQLFAAGYAACFENAILHLGRQQKLRLDGTIVDATVNLHSEQGPFLLAVELAVQIPELGQAEAETLVEEAHKICPYSNAIRNNVVVETTVAGK